MSSQESEIAVLTNQIQDLLEWRSKFMDAITIKLDKIDSKLADVVASRPSWGTLALITFLSCLSVGLLVHSF